MFNHYLKTALRQLLRDRVFSFINVFGLAVGVASSLLIALYVWEEFSYDRMHPHAGRTYRLACEYFLPNDGGSELRAAIGPPLGPVVQQDFPQVEAFVRIRKSEDVVIEKEGSDERFFETIYLIDSTAFQVFDIPLLAGNPREALKQPNHIILSESAAKKYFGQTDVLGKRLRFPEDSLELMVSAVMEDMPSNTHLASDFLMPYHFLEAQGAYLESWWSFNNYTYLLLKEGTDAAAFEEEVKRISARHISEQESGSGYRQEYFLQALTDIHLHSKLRGELTANNEAKYVYMFALVGVLILFIACINFTNLATARAARRAREVGMRKVVGASRPQLIVQLLGEALVLSAISMLLAIGLVYLALPPLNQLTGQSLAIGTLFHPTVLLALLGLTGLVGLVSGIYPALFLSAYEPVKTLKGTLGRVARGHRLREGLVVFQFCVSIMLIAGTLVIYQQLKHMQAADLGFAKEQVVFIPTHGATGTRDGFQLLKETLTQLPAVNATSLSSSVPGRSMSNNVVRKGWTDEAEWSDMRFIRVDEDFLDLYRLELVAGRNFDESFGTDQEEAFLLNESGMRRLGWTDPEQALNQKLKWQRRRGRVIGIVKDFFYLSVQNPIEPCIFVMNDDGPSEYLSISLEAGDPYARIEEIRRTYEDVLPGQAFEYAFLDEDFDRQYRTERQLGRLFVYFTLLAIFIACLGLFGLSAFEMSQRVKEISIRKILGASLPSIAFLLVRKFVWLIGVAFLVALPLSWYGLTQWLEGFAYRIETTPTHFLLAGVLALGIALVSMSYHIWRSARTNPAQALRNE